jgi:hypothetical protein
MLPWGKEWDRSTFRSIEEIVCRWVGPYCFDTTWLKEAKGGAVCGNIIWHDIHHKKGPMQCSSVNSLTQTQRGRESKACIGTLRLCAFAEALSSRLPTSPLQPLQNGI